MGYRPCITRPDQPAGTQLKIHYFIGKLPTTCRYKNHAVFHAYIGLLYEERRHTRIIRFQVSVRIIGYRRCRRHQSNQIDTELIGKPFVHLQAFKNRGSQISAFTVCYQPMLIGRQIIRCKNPVSGISGHRQRIVICRMLGKNPE